MSKATQTTTRPVILLVDDQEDILDFIGADLGTQYQVRTALDGQAALDILKSETIHLVVSDVMMPVMDGFQLCREIKTNFVFSHVPIVLLTAKNTLQAKIQGLELGADAYIEKPFSPAHLQAQIASLLANRAHLKRYFASHPLAAVESMAHSPADAQFLEKMNAVIQQQLDDPDLDVEKLAASLYVSRPTLYRKIKVLTDLTPYELINITRLKQAALLLSERKYRIFEVAAMVGYRSQNQLGRCFLKQFGMTPTAYLHADKQEDSTGTPEDYGDGR